MRSRGLDLRPSDYEWPLGVFPCLLPAFLRDNRRRPAPPAKGKIANTAAISAPGACGRNEADRVVVGDSEAGVSVDVVAEVPSVVAVVVVAGFSVVVLPPAGGEAVVVVAAPPLKA